ncbi:hypothetical protein C8J57DRAFT_1538485 [Mycena rebaudengoi]|nr:hypothetical protein C8J57DRAFT_1538485 [Mycena rebaudengoi]
MANSGSFAPPGESAYDLWVERSNLNGVVLAAVTYGILFTVTFQTLLIFFQLPKRKVPWGFVTYISAMFTLASIGFGTNAKFNQMTYIDNRNIPGGPNAFTLQYYSIPLNLTGFVCYTMMSWLADGLVLWRFTLIFNYKYWVSVVPALMLMGSVASSIALTSSKSVQFGVAYWSLSISLNTILTISIASRILFVRHRIRKALGSQHSGQYLSITAILVESAALYALWGLVFLICYARNTPLQNIILPPLGQIQGIGPLLILFRVAQGRAWSQNTATATSNQPSDRTHSYPLTELTVNGEGSRHAEGPLKINMTTDTVTEWDGGKTAV